MTTIKLELEFWPPPNARGNASPAHWSGRSRPRRLMRQSGIEHGQIYMMQHPEIQYPLKRVRLSYTFYGPYTVDTLNLVVGMKGFEDGLQVSSGNPLEPRSYKPGCGLITSDSPVHMEYGYIRRVKASRGQERVEILIEEIE